MHDSFAHHGAWGMLRASVMTAAALASTTTAGAADPPAAAALLDPTDPTTSLGRAIAAHDLGEPLRSIEAQIERGSARVKPERALPSVRTLFTEPWSLPETAASIAQSTRRERHGHSVAAFAAASLGAEPPSPLGTGRQTIASAYHATQALDYLLRGGDYLVRGALDPMLASEGTSGSAAGADAGTVDDESLADEATALAALERRNTERAKLAQEAMRLLAILERSPMPTGEDAAHAAQLAERAARVDWQKLAAAAALADIEFNFEVDWSTAETTELPPELAGAVEGTVLEIGLLEPIGLIVVGGLGPNRYDMHRIAAVFDPGGDDVYEWPDDIVGSRVIVDLAGNDIYRSLAPVGPGGALLGFSFLRDDAGNDIYEGTTLSSGAALLGVAILIDGAGDDIHRARCWSQGAAMFGMGMLLDGGGSDLYEGRQLCQGVGGPRGAGALVDRAGNDLYALHGAPSVYDTPATYAAFGQGVGYGARRDLPGGIGALVDDGGDDRYEAGEFAQGGGYFGSLGVLADRSGRDLYRADRYAQGFAAHQAFGALLDDAGDDVYWSRTAAGQGAGWDECAAVLIDRSGNDHYRADGLSQGAAAQQSIAALVDLDGDDFFEAVGSAVQGAGGGAEYRYAECQCFSLGVLIKRGGTARYSSGKPAGAVTFTADIKPDDPRASSAFGLLIDESGAPRADRGGATKVQAAPVSP